MALRGTVHLYGDHVDTDIIIAARYLNTTDPVSLPSMSGRCRGRLRRARARRGFHRGRGKFGCGSSREHAPIAIKAAGVAAVVAKSFARIFFRNAINVGLPILESPEAAAAAHAGDELEIDLTTGIIRNLTQGKSYQAQPFPDFLREIIDVGGLVPYVRAKIA